MIARSAPSPSLGVAETHGIALQPGIRLIAHSDGRGWRDLYGSLATETPWAATLAPVAHHCLVYCVQHRATIRRAIDGEGAAERAILEPRRLTIIPAGVPSRWEVDGRPDILLLYLRRSMMDRVVEQGFGGDAARAEIMPRLAFVDPLLEQLAVAVLDCLNDQAVGGFYVDSLAAMIATRLVARHMRLGGHEVRAARLPGDGDPRLARVRDRIEAALAEPLTLARLAAEAGVGADRLGRAFRARYGETLHRYITRRRIERAKELLRATDLPIVEVALAAGFASQSHLSIWFRRLVGVTPAHYRRGGAA